MKNEMIKKINSAIELTENFYSKKNVRISSVLYNRIEEVADSLEMETEDLITAFLIACVSEYEGEDD